MLNKILIPYLRLFVNQILGSSCVYCNILCLLLFGLISRWLIAENLVWSFLFLIMKAVVSVLLRLLFSLISITANGAVLVSLWTNSFLRSQPNLLLGNLALADFLMGVGYLYSTFVTFATNFQPSLNQCVFSQFPLLWATYSSICSVVPIAHYRVKLIKAYSRSAGSTDFAETWVFTCGLCTLWISSFVGALLCFFHKQDIFELEACILPMIFTDNYLMPYFLFTTTITTMIVTEYVRLIIFVTCGSRLFSFSKSSATDKWQKYVKFDPRVSRIVIVMAGTYIICWIPHHLAILYYLYPYGKQPYEFSYNAHANADLLTILPLLHSTINPFIYSLSEKEFRERIWQMIHTRRRSGLHPPPIKPPPPPSPRWQPPQQPWFGAKRKWAPRPTQAKICYTVSNNVPLVQIAHSFPHHQPLSTPRLTKVRRRISYFENEAFVPET